MASFEEQLIRDLRNPKSTSSVDFRRYLAGHNQEGLEEILARVCKSMHNSGLTPEPIKNSIALYGVAIEDRGILLAYEDFKLLWERRIKDCAIPL